MNPTPPKKQFCSTTSTSPYHKSRVLPRQPTQPRNTLEHRTPATTPQEVFNGLGEFCNTLCAASLAAKNTALPWTGSGVFCCREVFASLRNPRHQPSYSQMMIRVSNHLLSVEFRFHAPILRFGDWIPREKETTWRLWGV